MTFSLVINHTNWVPERVDAINDMIAVLTPAYPDTVSPLSRFMINGTDYRGTDWQVSKVKWALDQWRWSAKQDVTHHVFMTDDLHIAPRFWDILSAMVASTGEAPIGLLSNHPQAPNLTTHWYKTNSWIVGPAYVLTHGFLLRFLPWFEALPDGPHTTQGTKGWANDDSSINEFVTQSGTYSLHPLPTVVEHRGDIDSTVGHGDIHSRERLSWRTRRWTEGDYDSFVWKEEPAPADIDAMCTEAFWTGADNAPMMKVGG